GGGGTTRACGLASQGLDNNAPYGVAMFVRGSVKNDWAAAPENQLWQFGGNLLKVELQVDAGATEFKVADAGWQNNCGAGDNDTVTLGSALTMACGTNPGNLKFEVPATDCYEFAVNAANKDAPVVTVKKAVLTTGGGETSDSGEIRIYGRDVLKPGSAESLIKTVKGAGTISVDQTQLGGDKRITRIEIQNLGTAGDLRIEDFQWTSNPKFSPAAQPVNVYYRRASGGYGSTTVTVGGKQYPCTPTTGDAYGCVVTGLPLYPYQNVSLSISNGSGSPETIVFNADTATQPVYTFSGIPEARVGTPGASGQAAAVPKANEVILFYKRKADDYDGWGVHLFPKDPAGADWTTWAGPLTAEGVDPVYGAYFRIQLPQNKTPAYSNNPPAAATFPNVLGFIIHKGDTKDPGSDQQITIAQDGNMVFVVSGVTDVSSTPQYNAIVKPVNYSAHWVTDDTVLWKAPTGVTFATLDLLYSPDASLTNNVNGGFDGNYVSVRLGAGTNPQIDYLKDLSTYPAFSLPATSVANAKAIARSQIYVVARNASGVVTYVTRAQIQGALDDLYAAAAKDVPLGPSYSGGTPTLRVWAPTALTDPGVTVQLYNADGSAHGDPVAMTLDPATGVWSVTGDSSWDRLFYTYTLRTYSNYGDTILTNTVSDPYAVSGNTDGARSQIVNLDDADLKPAGWDAMSKPALAAPEDAVLYELHVRDFSIADTTVPAADRGKFTAFDIAGTAGRQHLQQMQQAGLTHVHLLPSFDIASVPENAASRVDIDDPVQKLCDAVADAASLCFNPANGAKTIRQLLTEITASGPTSLDQQKIVGWINGLDGFNWGYDPYHYGSPEGSYSKDPNGAERVLDFRRMVKGLSDIGLRTVMDVVYNHTASSGMNDKSVFDRIVPGYYQRRDIVTGGVTNKQCCNDMGTEWKMGEKLMFDTSLRWVNEYKVDGFRFDIMAAHTKDQMQRLLEATRAINPAFYIYGEGWNTGGGQDDKRYVSARQDNLAGTGIGSFNDRIRDAVRGGGCCDSGAVLVNAQGITSGLWYDPNSANSGSAAEKSALLDKADRIRAQLAGGIKSYTFQNAAGATVAGSTLGSYVTDPSELVNYVEVHDNTTFWDVSQFKQPTGTPTAERVRAQNVGTSFVLLAEGVPFLHAGQEILRSKSTDTNSYNSGDWFNDIDWTLATSKWAIGLPPQGDNQGSKAQAIAALSDPSAATSQSDRQFAFDVTKDWLKIRKSSVLFRLRTADQIKARMTMLNTGPSQQAGVIAYRLDGCSSPELPGQPYGAVVTIFNPTTSWTQLAIFKDETFALHPVQAAGADAVVKTATHDAASGFRVPPRTTAVFVKAA
ncbi:MAG TPA: pullulanase-type alpha-1,6-glucosidase, partial [Steroidobacteraceae bacterium]